MALAVSGTISIDSVETPGGSVEAVLGGSCAYFAAAASIQGPVHLVAAVGEDWPESHRHLLESFSGIHLEGLDIRPGGRTFAWKGRYAQNMNIRETLSTDMGVVDGDPPAVPDTCSACTYLFLANTHPREQTWQLDRFPAAECVVLDTMDLWITTEADELAALLHRVHGVIINDGEAEALTGLQNTISAGREILAMGPRFAVIKKGAHGCVLVHEDGVAVLPAWPADDHEVVDPTGAGDCFAGGMMGYLVRAGVHAYADLQAALTWGTVTASYVLGSFSLDGLVGVTMDDLSQRVNVFRGLCRP